MRLCAPVFLCVSVRFCAFLCVALTSAGSRAQIIVSSMLSVAHFQTRRDKLARNAGLPPRAPTCPGGAAVDASGAAVDGAPLMPRAMAHDGRRC
eukprot:2250422-Rhodomonas_salina.1